MDELKHLEMRNCKSVADIVEGMGQCSIGARMLGEVAGTIVKWIESEKPPVAIYDGKLDNPFGRLLEEMVDRGWFLQIYTPEDYVRRSKKTGGKENAIVIGTYPERIEDCLFDGLQVPIFINQFGITKLDQITDGYFPDVVFADPRFVIPIIFSVLEEKLNNRPETITKFIEKLSQYGGLASEVQKGAYTLFTMVEDPECSVFLTLSGVMTIAKMGLVICDMIETGMVQLICSTGALMAHGLVESIGLKHFKYNPMDDDATLAKNRINRVTDTLELESNLDHIEGIVDEVLTSCCERDFLSPRIFHAMIGKYLSEKYPDQAGILKSAYERKVPVLVPAFHDSEIGNDLYIHNRKRETGNKSPIIMNQELDSQFLIDMVSNSKKIGIFTIGGGVPRNYIQNVAPLIEIMNERMEHKLPMKKFSYGCRICPDPMYYGHLSGCTYSEGMSWRKMETNGQFSEIRADATQIWPFLVKFVMENQNENKKLSEKSSDGTSRIVEISHIPRQEQEVYKA
jgi:deoxyhypusine synthase